MADFSLEDQYDGVVCGLDEVGRGPLAGPVVAACVVIPRDKRSLDFVAAIADSKKVSPVKREELFKQITAHFPYAISALSPLEIDESNILQASLTAMKNAHDQISGVTYALVDYGWERNAGYPTAEHRQALLVHGVTPHHRRSFAPVRKILES